MSDYWSAWSADQPEFDGPPGEDVDDPTAEQPDDDGFPVEGFGTADPDDLGTPADPPMPLGYDDLPAGPGVDPYAEADPYPEAESEFGPDSYPEVPAEVGFGAADPPVGADPDLDPYADTGPAWWEPSELPELGTPPEPVDGLPWADPALLGAPPPPLSEPDAATVPPPDAATVPPDELAEYAGEELPADGEPWSALVASEDPATSTLARFWLPDER